MIVEITDEVRREGAAWLATRLNEHADSIRKLPKQGDLLAVYGTLKRRGGNHVLLSGAGFIGDARTQQQFPLHHICLLPFPGHGLQIECEVWRPTATNWGWIDRLEGHPYNYVRVPVPVVLAYGLEVTAWMYFYPHVSSRTIACSSSFAS